MGYSFGVMVNSFPIIPLIKNMNKNYLIVLAVIVMIISAVILQRIGRISSLSNSKDNSSIKGFYKSVIYEDENWNLKPSSKQPELHLTDEMKDKPLKSSAWWKHVAVNGCDSSLFPTPYIVEVGTEDITIGLQDMNATPKTIFVKRDPSLKLKLEVPAENCRVKSGDSLSSIIEISSGEKSLDLKLVKGSPKIIIESNNYGWDIEAIKISEDNKLISITDHNERDFIMLSDANTHVISYIPSSINKSDYINGLNTNFSVPQIDFRIDDDTLIQTFKFESPDVFVLLPHHHNYLDNQIESFDFGVTSPKGRLSFVETDEISIKFPLKVPNVFPDIELQNEETQLLSELLSRDIQNSESEINNDSGVYWKGKTLAKYANLMYVADQIKDETNKNKLLSELKNELADWFEYSGEDDSKYFIYDDEMRSLISSKPEFGHEELNDHHFHYGYYIYTMSAIAKYDQEFAGKYSDMVEYLVRDVASFDSDDPSFPHLRHFDVYDGHSYASGLNYMVDGNNQESSSEAVNFWYGAYMWELNSTGNSDNNSISDLMLAGYTLESLSVKEYYFNTGSNSESFPTEYEFPIKSIIFEGKHDYATWFSADPNAIHGIQVLPITVGSTYLMDSEFYRNNYNFQNSSAEDPETWKDITALYLILNSDEDGKRMIDDAIAFDSGNSRTWSNFIYYLVSRK